MRTIWVTVLTTPPQNSSSFLTRETTSTGDLTNAYSYSSFDRHDNRPLLTRDRPFNCHDSRPISMHDRRFDPFSLFTNFAYTLVTQSLQWLPLHKFSPWRLLLWRHPRLHCHLFFSCSIAHPYMTPVLWPFPHDYLKHTYARTHLISFIPLTSDVLRDHQMTLCLIPLHLLTGQLHVYCQTSKFTPGRRQFSHTLKSHFHVN